MTRLLPLLAALALLVPAVAQGHPERLTTFPDKTGFERPTYRTTGSAVVVCKSDSRARLKTIYKGRGKKTTRIRNRRLKLLKKCRFRDIQPAINAAKTGYRIQIMPGVYEENPSRAVPKGEHGQPPCPDDYVETEGVGNDAPPPAGPRSNDPPVRPNRNYHVKCPNSKNLLAVIGDPTPESDPGAPSDPVCHQLCKLQIEGLGKKPEDVLIVGDRKKDDVLRVDRAHGIYIRNLALEQAAFNAIDLVEVEGFVVKDVVARYNANYGVLSFTSTKGLYDNIEAYGNGDSGVYPGSAKKGCALDDYSVYGTCEKTGCQTWTTEIRHSKSYNNVLGYSGTAGNSTWVHDNEFHDNAAGLFTDSFALGHPGMPQECVKWENNRIYSNNNNHFSRERQDQCRSMPWERQPRTRVCPQFQVPVGTGIGIGGGNRNLIRNNQIYDNWRWGIVLFWVPAAIRNDNDPSHQEDTSNGNRFVDNRMGMRPDGTADANGTDFYWDEQGRGNCWQDNTSKSKKLSDPGSLPDCPEGSAGVFANRVKTAQLAPCAAWDPNENTHPPGCNWFDVPPEP